MSAALIDALRAHAAGLHPDEAGTELLICHGDILLREDFTGFVHTGTSISDGTTLMASIDWDAAITALDGGLLPCSSGERHMLRLAASIAAGVPVNLSDALTGIDHRNARLLTTAVLRANGQ